MNVKTHTMQFASAISPRLLRIAGLAALMTLLASGAAFGQQVEQTRGNEQQVDEVVTKVAWNAPVVLHVRNNNWLDARVYAVRQGTRYRLGTVTSLQIEQFELPAFATTDVEGVQILVLPIGARASHLTQPMTVMPGDVLGLDLEQHLPLSAFFRAG